MTRQVISAILLISTDRKKEVVMSQPFIYVATWRIKEGKLDEYKQFYKRLVDIVESNEPQIISFNNFLNEDQNEMTMIQVHPDAASMDYHMNVLSEHLGDAFRTVADFIEVKSIGYYGTPPDSFMASISGREISLDAKALYMGGFARSSHR
jgi:quinol monooxygenase YgiN